MILSKFWELFGSLVQLEPKKFWTYFLWQKSPDLGPTQEPSGLVAKKVVFFSQINMAQCAWWAYQKSVWLLFEYKMLNWNTKASLLVATPDSSGPNFGVLDGWVVGGRVVVLHLNLYAWVVLQDTALWVHHWHLSGTPAESQIDGPSNNQHSYQSVYGEPFNNHFFRYEESWILIPNMVHS